MTPRMAGCGTGCIGQEFNARDQLWLEHEGAALDVLGIRGPRS